MPGADVPTAWRMRALEAAGGLAWWAADVPGAHASYEGQLALARTLGDQRGIADALFNLIHTQFLVHPEDSAALEAMRAEADAIYRALGDDLRLARLTWTTAYPLAFAGKSEEARAVIAGTLEEFERAEDDFYIALVSAAMGGIALMERDVPTAVRLGLRSLQANQAMGDVASITLTLRAAAALWAIGRRARGSRDAPWRLRRPLPPIRRPATDEPGRLPGTRWSARRAARSTRTTRAGGGTGARRDP